MPHSILLALTQLGYEAVIFDYQKYLCKFDGNRIFKKAAHIIDKFFFEKRCLNINSYFLQHIEDFRPNLIIVVKGVHVLPKTLQEIKQIGIPVVNWHVDDFFNPRYTTPYSDEVFRLYDIHFSSRPHLFEEYWQRGANRVEYLEFCFDPTIFYPLDSVQNRKLLYDVSLIGNWSKSREQWLKGLSPFFEIFIWGGSWHHTTTLKKEPNIHIMYKRADLEDYSRVVSKSKICLNILTKENRDETNLRNFEISACKGFQLCNRTQQLLSIFKEDEEIALYGTTEELIDKVRHYLEHEDERNEIAKKGFEMITSGEHTFLSRCKEVVSKVGVT
jgi:spore maturation protein CgeB